MLKPAHPRPAAPARASARHSRCPGASAHDRDPAARTACGWPARPWCPLAARAQAVAERVSVHARQRPAAPPSSAPAAPALPASGCPPSWIACAPARSAGASSGRTSIPAVCPVLDTGKTAPGVDSRPGSRPGCSRVRPWHAAAIVVLDRSRSSLCRAEQGGPGQPTVRNARCAGLRGRQCYAVASADDGAIALTRPASHLIGSSSGLRPEAGGPGQKATCPARQVRGGQRKGRPCRRTLPRDGSADHADDQCVPSGQGI